MRFKTARKRRIRNVWKRRGHAHIEFNRGSYTWFELISPDGVKCGAMHIPFERSQPRAYRYYPKGV